MEPTIIKELSAYADPVIENYLPQIDILRMSSSPTAGDELKQMVQKAIGEIQAIEDRQAHTSDIGNMRQARELATDVYDNAHDQMALFAKKYSKPDLNAEDVLRSYAAFYHEYREGGCNEDVDPQTSKEADAYISCPALSARDQAIQSMVDVGFANPAEAMTNRELYGWVTITPRNDLRRLTEFEEFDDYENHYAQIAFAGGYWYQIPVKNWPAWLQMGGPLVELGGSLVRGDLQNLGSHRFQYELHTGWKQPLYTHQFSGPRVGFDVFISPKVGIGYATNFLNFGLGAPLEKKHSLMWISQVVGGVDFNWHTSASIFMAAGYDYGRTLWTQEGLDPFLNRGLMVQGGFSADLPHDFLKRLFQGKRVNDPRVSDPKEESK